MSELQKWSRQLNLSQAKLIHSLILTLFCCSCLSSQNKEKDSLADSLNIPSKNESFQYKFKKGQIIKNPQPLPWEHPITLQKYSMGKLIEEYPIYRGWDIDQNGYIDVLEMLDEKGTTIGWLYDMNGDGKVDAKDYLRYKKAPE